MSKHLPCEVTTMVMIQNPETREVLVQERVLSWKGFSFPGGHIEDNESFCACAIREVREETGLEIEDLTSCGTVHWLNSDTQERYLVFLYKTSHYSGTFIPETVEGRNFWIHPDELKKLPDENGFHRYLPMFLEARGHEAFGLWNAETQYPVEYFGKQPL